MKTLQGARWASLLVPPPPPQPRSPAAPVPVPYGRTREGFPGTGGKVHDCCPEGPSGQDWAPHGAEAAA